MKISKFLKVFFLVLAALVLNNSFALAQASGLNSAATNCIPDACPTISPYLLKRFPLNSINGIGFTYWSFRQADNGNIFAHTALDIGDPIGIPVFAIESGVVIEPMKPKQTWFGNHVVVNSSIGLILYGHLDDSIVKPNDVAILGTQLGTVGKTGLKKPFDQPHLHLQFGTEVEPNFDNMNPIKHWFYHFKASEISPASPIVEPLEANKKPYAVLSRASDGSLPKTINITAVAASRFSGLYNYSVRAVLYINGQRVKAAGGNPVDQLASMDGSVTFPNVTLPELPADRIYHISVVLFDTEEVQTDSSGNKLYFVSQNNSYAVADPIARADLDLMVKGPVVSIVYPLDGETVTERTITVAGRIDNFQASSAAMSINGREQTIAVSYGTFASDAILTSGKNTIIVTATEDGETGTASATVTADVPPSKLWVQMTWDQGQSDVDLYLTEPTGEIAWFAHQQNSSGGFIDVDNTSGYGPEHYVITETTGNPVAPGDYTIRVHYFDSSGNPGGITGKLTILKDEKPYGVFPFTISTPNGDASGPDGWNIDATSWWEKIVVPMP